MINVIIHCPYGTCTTPFFHVHLNAIQLSCLVLTAHQVFQWSASSTRPILNWQRHPCLCPSQWCQSKWKVPCPPFFSLPFTLHPFSHHLFTTFPAPCPSLISLPPPLSPTPFPICTHLYSGSCLLDPDLSEEELAVATISYCFADSSIIQFTHTGNGYCNGERVYACKF